MLTLHHLAVWRLVDGKPGHENQSRGLIQALQDVLRIQSYDVPVAQASIRQLLFTPAKLFKELPAPNLIIAAGHSTHLPALVARRHFGGKIVILMTPSLPVSWFDLCIVPEHDGVNDEPHTLMTRGVLNQIRPTKTKDPNRALVLVGGPSRHYSWDERELIAQIETVIDRRPPNWVLATSRRTPQTTITALRQLSNPYTTLVEPPDVAADWLPAQLARASVVWVTEDSVSMVYEAVTSGAACGLLHVPQRGPNRVSSGLKQLIADGYIAPYNAFAGGRSLAAPATPLYEARRCALWIKKHWFPHIAGRQG